MTVLEGQARKAQPAEADDALLALLSGKDTAATQIIKLARERYRFGVMATGDVYGVPSQALADALLVLEGEAQSAEPADAALRVGADAAGRLVLDLGGDAGQVVVLSADGWQVTGASPVLFRRTNATLPLPVPARGGLRGLSGLRRLLNIRDEDWPLILAWLAAALFANVPHPVLLLRGEQGTAKSSAARMLTSLLDPCASQLRAAPRNVEDWAVAASGSWVTCLDNISDIPPWLSDALCRAVTGDGLLRRQLYTDSDVNVRSFQRVLAMTSIDPGRLHGDLADRLLVVELDRITEDERAADQKITAEWRRIHPAVLGGLLDLTAAVLGVLPGIRTARLPRMADFAQILLAVDKVLGTSGYAHYAEQAAQIAEQAPMPTLWRSPSARGSPPPGGARPANCSASSRQRSRPRTGPQPRRAWAAASPAQPRPCGRSVGLPSRRTAPGTPVSGNGISYLQARGNKRAQSWNGRNFCCLTWGKTSMGESQVPSVPIADALVNTEPGRSVSFADDSDDAVAAALKVISAALPVSAIWDEGDEP